ncbi:2-C-methyl-D-erythritol 4-phosphate cytidylyltransferase [Amycolatopsis bartoniae]|uniref:2-C-methyl-D-erythritol 4-phosphate cytidylyltransferase n=1 Tax=Amycolatopsis bartoniae TaxID=941986 RepID=A0A8H9J4N6_9PSEU|nr:2-C-methyl-D-erythritol 4-phosphate cytidylyltransferase [Amycolatopsis bartoniae]MBB2935098.1 2-C-methyl-D-erythritol 4-phosphate cytidylyltransferase [Amycolatopsis bartoniae]TVT06979.1 hypothetical protein FNH07_17710 [Amycolatopsis bartoniae]GHF74336.1 2-C-methyl-D-erythritol 4-phosphate cytidylyltransferase [Amycolatopsis bartoniae]
MSTAALVIADAEGLDVVVQGKTLLAHALRGVEAAGCVDFLVVAVPANRLGSYEPIVQARPGTGERCRVLSCDGTRAESIRQAFESLSDTAFDVILLCDAARAFVPPGTVTAVVDAVRAGAPAAVPVLPVTDTVKLVDSSGVIIATEDRSRLRTVQAPFACTPSVLREACARGLDLLTELPGTVRTVAGHQNAIRLTTEFDVSVAEALLNEERA